MPIPYNFTLLDTSPVLQYHPFPYAPISVLFLKYLASDLGLPTMGNEKAFTEEAARSAYVIAPLSRPSVQNGPPPTSLMSKVRKRKGESK